MILEKKGSKIEAIASDSYLNNSDVIIGPFYYNEAKLISNLVKAPVVFPMYSKSQHNLTSSKIIKIAPNKNKIFRNFN